MQIHELLHELHLHVHRQHQSPEDLRHHLSTDHIVVMERPADSRIPAFRLGLADVVHDSRPTQPEVIRPFGDIVEHLERMVEIILVGPAVLLLDDIEGREFRQYDIQQSATLQVDEPTAGEW